MPGHFKRQRIQNSRFCFGRQILDSGFKVFNRFSLLTQEMLLDIVYIEQICLVLFIYDVLKGKT